MKLVVATKSGLPPAQHNFCHFLVADPKMDATAAYWKLNPEIKKASAGIQAGRLLDKAEVRAYIFTLMEAREKRLEMDQDWVIARLRDIHDRCMEAEPVWKWERNEGDPDGEKEAVPVYAKFDASGATRALELIGRHMKMFSDKVDSAAMNVVMNIDLGNDKPAIEGEFKRVSSN